MSRLATATAVLLAAACSQPVAKSGRYRMASDPGSRHGFEYVQDRETGRWVIRDCELRVAEARYEPLEVIELPPLGDTPPGQWSGFLRAGQLRPGAFGW